MSGVLVVVYFGRDGQTLNIPFMHLSIIGCLTSARPLIGSIKTDRVERAVFIEEYSTPVWKSDVRNSMVSFGSGRMRSWFRPQQNLSHFSIYGFYRLTVCGRQFLVSMSTGCSEIFELRQFCQTLDRQGDLALPNWVNYQCWVN